MKFKSKGSALIEYALPIALIGLVVGLGLYHLASSGALTNLFANTFNAQYSSSTKTLEINKKSDNVSLLINPAAGSFGGTSAQPVSKCNSTNCSVDFGEFILTGIPENLADYVASNGTSGGVEEMCKLMHQIADQLEEKGDTAGAADYRNLANLGHFIGDLQEQIELAATECKVYGTLSSSGICMNNKLDSILHNAPNNIKTLIPNFVGDASSIFQPDNSYLSLGQTMKQLKEGTINHSIASYSPSYNIVTTFDKINNDPKYSPSMKGVTTELYRILADLSHSTFNRFSRLNNYLSGIPYTPGYKIDPVTGQLTTEMDETYTLDNSIINDIEKPKSKETDLDSTLICTTGKNKSDGTACD